MKRPFFRKPNRNLPAERSSAYRSGSLEALRLRILEILLLGGMIAGGFAVIYRLVSNTPQDVPAYNWPVLILCGVGYLGIILLTYVKQIPYRPRALGLLAIIYIFGLIILIQGGIAGNGRVWLLGFAALSGILFGMNAGLAALGLSALSWLVVGALTSQGQIIVNGPTSLPSPTLFMDWVNSGAVFLLVTVTIVISLAVLVNGLNTLLKQEKSLTQEISGDRGKLNQRIQRLERRMVQMRTAGEISRSINAELDPNALMKQVVELVRERFDLYYVGIFLMDEQGEYAVLRAGTGEAGGKMIAEGYKLPIGGPSIMGWTMVDKRPRIALDVGEEAVRFSNPLLPQTRSEMALPILSGEQVLGVLNMHSAHPWAFDEDDIPVLQGMADSLGTALQNAHVFQQAEKNLDEIRSLNRQYLAEAWTNVTHTPEMKRYTYAREEVDETEEVLPSLSLPLVLRDQVIGQISFETDRQTLSPDEMKFVEQVTTQAAVAMENVRLMEETQRRAGRERLVAEIVAQSRGSADVNAILRTTLGELGKVLKASGGQISLQVAETIDISQETRREQ